jgi:hypothetical protein
MDPLLSVRLRVCLALPVAGLLIAGCSVGKVQTVPWTREDIRPQERLIVSIEPQEAWYWQGSDGKLNIVLARRDRSIINKDLSFTWVMSLVLEDMPAGREKLYRVDSRTVRQCQSFAGDHRRAKSATGVAVIERSSSTRLKGRFHFWIRQQQFSVLTGWTPPLPRAPMAIAVGRFEATLDPGKGKPLLDLTEANGFDRASDARAVTRPASRAAPATATAPG